jgi:dihydrofolate reductase
MNAIAAVYSDWGIGLGGAQTIVIPEDRRRFKALTYSGVVIAGRRTFEGFREPLPKRKHIILTRNHAFLSYGVAIAHSITEALAEIKDGDPDKVFVIGGGDIYRLFLPLCAYAYITKIDAAPQSDTFFPNLDNASGWSLESREYRTWDPESGIDSIIDKIAADKLPHISAHCTTKKKIGIYYSFNLYKNNNVEVEGKHV